MGLTLCCVSGPPAPEEDDYENSQDIDDVDADAEANLQFSGSEDEGGDKDGAGADGHSSDDGGDDAGDAGGPKKDPLDFSSESGSDSNMFGGESSGGV